MLFQVLVCVPKIRQPYWQDLFQQVKGQLSWTNCHPFVIHIDPKFFNNLALQNIFLERFLNLHHKCFGM